MFTGVAVPDNLLNKNRAGDNAAKSISSTTADINFFWQPQQAPAAIVKKPIVWKLIASFLSVSEQVRLTEVHPSVQRFKKSIAMTALTTAFAGDYRNLASKHVAAIYRRYYQSNPNRPNQSRQKQLIWAVRNGDLRQFVARITHIKQLFAVTDPIDGTGKNLYRLILELRPSWLDALFKRFIVPVYAGKPLAWCSDKLFGANCLYWAACFNQVGYMALLLSDPEAKLAIKYEDHRRDTALNAACRGGFVEAMGQLIDAGADLESEWPLRSPMGAAMLAGQDAAVKCLIEHEVALPDTKRFLLKLIRRGHVSSVKRMIGQSEGSTLRLNESELHEHLLIVAEKGLCAMVTWLLDQGASMAAKNEGDDTALMLAAKSGHQDVLEILLQRQTDLSSQQSDESIVVALRRSIRYGRISACKLLLSHLPKSMIQKNIASCLEIAVARPDANTAIALTQLLLKSVTDIAWIRNRGVVKAAARAGHVAVVAKLLDKGLACNDGDHLYSSCKQKPLYAAVRSRHVDAAKLLLQRGADPNAVGGWLRGYDIPMISVASELGDLDMVKLLLEFGADVNQESTIHAFRERRSVIYFACYSDNIKLVRYLLENGANYRHMVWKHSTKGYEMKALYQDFRLQHYQNDVFDEGYSNHLGFNAR